MSKTPKSSPYSAANAGVRGVQLDVVEPAADVAGGAHDPHDGQVELAIGLELGALRLRHRFGGGGREGEDGELVADGDAQPLRRALPQRDLERRGRVGKAPSRERRPLVGGGDRAVGGDHEREEPVLG